MENTQNLQEVVAEQQTKVYFYRINFQRLYEALSIYLIKGSIRRDAFLDTCSNSNVFTRIIDGNYAITGKFIEELDNFYINRAEDGILIRDEAMREDRIYLNKRTKNFITNITDEERTKIYHNELEMICS